MVAGELDIPYLLAETSFAPKQAGGPSGAAMRRTEQAIRRADVVLVLTAQDAECLAPLVSPPAELRRLPPFLDPAPYQLARAARERHRAELAARFGLDPAKPWLLVVAMMRADVKRCSYLLLAEALGRLQARDWQLLVVGDGPARAEIEARLRPARAGASRLRGRDAGSGPARLLRGRGPLRLARGARGLRARDARGGRRSACR